MTHLVSVACWQVVRVLADHGADLDMPARESTDEGGMTALMAAAWGGHLSCVRVLVLFGANASAVSWAGNSACVIARRRGHGELSQWLQAYGHASPLTVAVESRNATDVMCLLRKGASPHQPVHLPWDDGAPATLLELADSEAGPLALPRDRQVTAVLRAAMDRWCPANHRVFPREMDLLAFLVLLIGQRVCVRLMTSAWQRVGRGSLFRTDTVPTQSVIIPHASPFTLLPLPPARHAYRPAPHFRCPLWHIGTG